MTPDEQAREIVGRWAMRTPFDMASFSMQQDQIATAITVAESRGAAAERERWRGVVREYLDAEHALKSPAGCDRLNAASRALLAMLEAP